MDYFQLIREILYKKTNYYITTGKDANCVCLDYKYFRIIKQFCIDNTRNFNKEAAEKEQSGDYGTIEGLEIYITNKKGIIRVGYLE